MTARKNLGPRQPDRPTTCPRCGGSLSFGTEDGRLIEWCDTCASRVSATVQQHRALGTCTHVERDHAVCSLPRAATRHYHCDLYCPAHCLEHGSAHTCRRSTFRLYMRNYKEKKRATARGSA